MLRPSTLGGFVICFIILSIFWVNFGLFLSCSSMIFRCLLMSSCANCFNLWSGAGVSIFLTFATTWPTRSLLFHIPGWLLCKEYKKLQVIIIEDVNHSMGHTWCWSFPKISHKAPNHQSPNQCCPWEIPTDLNSLNTRANSPKHPWIHTEGPHQGCVCPETCEV